MRKALLPIAAAVIAQTTAAATFDMQLSQVANGSTNGESVAASLTTGGTWTYDTTAKTLTLVGTQTNLFDLSPLPNNELFTHVMTDAAFDLVAATVTGSAYECIDGAFGSTVGADLCGGYNYGNDFIENSSTDYTTIPGTLNLGGDDQIIEPQQQLSDYGATVVSFNGSTLVLRTPDWNTDGPDGTSTDGYELEFAAQPETYPLTLIQIISQSSGGSSIGILSGTRTGNYHPETKVITMDAGTFSMMLDINPLPNNELFTHNLTDMVWNLDAGTISVAAFACVEHGFGPTVGAFICANTNYGNDYLNDTTVDYSTVPGTRMVGGDDQIIGDQQQATDHEAIFGSWDGTTLIAYSPDYSSGTSGWQYTFSTQGPPELPPTVIISAPADGATVYADQNPYNLVATADDAWDGDLTAQLGWFSSIDGPLVSPATLSPGLHTITATVTDSSGLTDSDNHTLRVVNAPSLTIGSPADGGTYVDSSPVALSGQATDVEDGDRSGAIQWSSDFAGSLGSGAALQVSLAAGVHVIRATVTDTDGYSPSTTPTARIVVQSDTDADSLPDVWESTFGVDDPNGDPDGDGVTTVDEYNNMTNPVDGAPQVSIGAPAAGYVAAADDVIMFSGSASDAEDGGLTHTLQWSSDRDGPLGTGASVPVQLSIGEHIITVTVADSQGAIVTASINVSVGTVAAGTGDIDGDGDLDIKDLIQLQQAIIGLESLE
jgi:hypothetical protein